MFFPFLSCSCDVDLNVFSLEDWTGVASESDTVVVLCDDQSSMARLSISAHAQPGSVVMPLAGWGVAGLLRRRQQSGLSLLLQTNLFRVNLVGLDHDGLDHALVLRGKPADKRGIGLRLFLLHSCTQLLGSSCSLLQSHRTYLAK
jgi:uncharacterized protein (TIGR03382 family)